MAEKELDQSFWDNRYIGRDTPWALNCATPALTEYMEDKKRDSSILIPGAGTSLEGIELVADGFYQHYILRHFSQCQSRGQNEGNGSLFRSGFWQYKIY
ncbi:MAG: hypothetical protein IPK25_15130 [Saprospiraceae bacterium]|nr:hypothetical protein [Saprospiraceae bacterium]